MDRDRTAEAAAARYAPATHPGMRGSPRTTTVEVLCGASPTPTRRRRIACAAAATVPTGRNRARNIPRGCGTRPARPPWKSGVGQAPYLRAAEGLPARLRRRCRPAGTVLAISRGDAGLAPRDHRGRPGVGQAPYLRTANGLPARLRRRCRPAGTVLAISRGDAGLAPHDHRGRPGVGQAPHLRAANGLPARLRRRCRAAGAALTTSRGEAGLAPHDHRGSPVWGKPHPHVPPKDCLRGCGDGADRTGRPSQYRP